METLYQGSKDVFLAKVRADFDALEDQGLKSTRSLKDYSLIDSDPMADTLFTNISNVTDDGDRAVWRHISVAGSRDLGSRSAGGVYPEATFIRGYETEVYDPDEQTAGEFRVPEEREAKEGKSYKAALSRAQKLINKADRENISDPFEVFNFAFTAPGSQPTRFFVKGTSGLDGNKSALGERLISTQHALASGAATVSNAVNSSGNALAFSDTAYWAAKEQGATFVDDVNDPMPMFGGRTTIVVPPANSLVRTAQEINKSEWKTGGSTNDVNVLNGLFDKIISSPYLLSSRKITTIANTKAWFLVDSGIRDTETGTGLVKVTFVPLQTRVERDNDRDSIVYKLKQEHVYGWADWRNIIGSNGLGTAYSS